MMSKESSKKIDLLVGIQKKKLAVEDKKYLIESKKTYVVCDHELKDKLLRVYKEETNPDLKILLQDKFKVA